jgi:hypothetical protein
MTKLVRVLSAAVVLAAALALVATSGGAPGKPKPCHRNCPPPPPPSTDCGTRTGPPATYAHVIWIWMENHSYSEIIGSSAAPYLNSLASGCGLATNYAAVTHPSLPNYIAATSGDTWGVADDNPPSSHPLAVDSIFQQAGSAGSYEESMPSNCALTSSGTYAVKHNPEAYYTNIRTACGIDNVPMGTTSSGAFATALSNGTLPKFTFVTPNLCNDMHDCSSGNHIPLIVVSPYTAAGTRSGTAFTHYSLLRTTEQLLGITSFLGNAAAASSMRAAFGL